MSLVPVESPGWDSDTVIVDGRYIERVPQRALVRAGLERECRVLPVIAPLLPLAVPVPTEVPSDETGPWRVRHEMLPGDAAVTERLGRADGRRVGTFLRVLHDLPLARLGLHVRPDGQFPQTLARMRNAVLPLVDPAQRLVAAELLDRAMRAVPSVLAHRDLGPEHLLVTDGSVSGVIDWTDAGLDDPAMDLAWTVHGTPPSSGSNSSTSTARASRNCGDHSTGIGSVPGTRSSGAWTGSGPPHIRSGLEGIVHTLAT